MFAFVFDVSVCDSVIDTTCENAVDCVCICCCIIVNVDIHAYGSVRARVYVSMCVCTSVRNVIG